MKLLFGDRPFFSTLVKLWIPIALQQLVFSLLNLVSVMMVGQLGEASIAAVSLANQVFFLFQLLLFGIGSGAAIFVAQFWGRKELHRVRHMLGLCLGLALLGAMVFTLIALVFPEQALSVYSTDPTVIALGSEYLQIAGLFYVAVALTTSFSVTLRSTGNVRLPVAISIFSLSLGAGLNYIFIFGLFGLPAFGVKGAAMGTLLARFIECGLLLLATYGTRSAAAASPREMFNFDPGFARGVLRTMVPVMVNEILWSVGISAYSLVYGRIGTDAIAAVSIAMTIENFAFVPFVGLSTAAAIMIGHRIGADEEHRALDYARQFLVMTIVLGALVGAVIFVAADFVLGFYKIGEAVRQTGRILLTIVAAALWIKSSNMMLIVGVLRAGGDTRYGFAIDVGTLWVIGLPAVVLGAFFFHLPVEWVYLLAVSDEVSKFILGSYRLVSKRWINNLARQHAAVELVEPVPATETP